MMILVIFLESIKMKRLLGVTMDTVVMHHFQIESNIKTNAPYHPLQESAFKFRLHTLHYQTAIFRFCLSTNSLSLLLGDVPVNPRC